MSLNIGRELAALKRMTPALLRERYAEVFGERSRSGNKQFLIKRIIWRLQADSEGDLSQRAIQRARELAATSTLRLNPPPIPIAAATPSATPPSRFIDDGRLPPVGAMIRREYRGRQIEVKVVGGGFEFEGEVYRSLSGVARAITGYATVNGYGFFNLRKSA